MFISHDLNRYPKETLIEMISFNSECTKEPSDAVCIEDILTLSLRLIYPRRKESRNILYYCKL